MSAAEQQILCFGIFELNVTTEELRKSGTIVKLPPQPLRLLALLASRACDVVTREEIQRQFWGEETEIDFERRMNQCIKQIRTALADNASQPTYIETVRLQGYRFLLSVESKTVAVPPPQVREASSSLIGRNVTTELRSRIASSLAGRSQQTPASEAGTVAPASEKSPAGESSRRLPMRYVALAIAVIAMLAGILYWYWQQ